MNHLAGRSLDEEMMFRELDFVYEQIAYVGHLAMDQRDIDHDIGINGLMSVVDCPAGRLSMSLYHGLQSPGTQRPHSTVTTDLEKDMIM
jgi:hypothetical protein